MTTIKVARLEQYPSENPTGWVVGFNISESGKSFYEVSTADYDEAKNEEEAVDVVYEKLKPTIDEKVETIRSNSSLLGKVYQPK